MGVTPDAVKLPVVADAATGVIWRTSMMKAGSEKKRIAGKPQIYEKIYAAVSSSGNASPASEEAGDVTSG